MKKTKLNIVLSYLLAIVLAICLVPIYAYAEEPESADAGTKENNLPANNNETDDTKTNSIIDDSTTSDIDKSLLTTTPSESDTTELGMQGSVTTQAVPEEIVSFENTEKGQFKNNLDAWLLVKGKSMKMSKH